MKFHGNSKNNDKPHHLYVIINKKTDDVFKYGISSESIDVNQLSKRITSQLRLMNLVAGWKQYYAKILIQNIDGRIEALHLEEQFINDYKVFHGEKPIGNQ
jgi:hypothetical protein